MTQHDPVRRRFLFGGAALGAGALLAACTSNEQPSDNTQTNAGGNTNPNATTLRARRSPSASPRPAADHGWIAAITNNAKAQAGDVLRRGVQAGRGRRRRGRPARRARRR